MLSINIPVFNIEVNGLVFQLVKQAEKLNLIYEIRVYDDASGDNIRTANSVIRKYPRVNYAELETNIGRSAIRNKMGFDSKYEYLLFIDADSKLIKDDYLSKFLKFAKPECVLCGGTSYQQDKPEDIEKILRWTYGMQREAISSEMRNSKKGFIITSNNFFIPKKIFEGVHFREDIRDYGHEDTVLGYDLFKKGIEILHIDNPVEHTGLEDADVFLQKSKTALKSLKYISEEIVKKDKDFVSQVHFLHRFSSIKKWLPHFFLRMVYVLFHSFLEKNLKSKNPNMKWFDLYRLSYFTTLKKP